MCRLNFRQFNDTNDIELYFIQTYISLYIIYQYITRFNFSGKFTYFKRKSNYNQTNIYNTLHEIRLGHGHCISVTLSLQYHIREHFREFPDAKQKVIYLCCEKGKSPFSSNIKPYDFNHCSLLYTALAPLLIAHGPKYTSLQLDEIFLALVFIANEV